MNYKISNNIEDVPVNILLDEEVLKNIWRRLSSSPSEDVFRTFSTCLDKDEYIRLTHTSSEDVFNTSSRRFELVFKMSSKRLQDVSKRLQDIFKISPRRLANMSFKTFSRSITKLNCLVNTFSIVFNTFLINLWSVYKLSKCDKNFSSFNFSIY